jgi:hypothetical protein
VFEAMKTRGEATRVRLAWVALCVLALPAGLRAQPATSLWSDGAGVIPDTTGQIAEVRLHYDPDLHYELKPLYQDLLIALPADVRIQVLCPTYEAACRFANTWGRWACEHDVRAINVGRPISVWARDRCIARESLTLHQMGASFVPQPQRSYDNEKRNDLRVAKLLHACGLAPPALALRLHLEGGNVVSNQQHVFVGWNAVDENGSSDLTESLDRELQAIFGRAYILVGNDFGEVPWCHVDMYLTPLGTDTVLVANPIFGEALVNRLLDENERSDSPLCFSSADELQMRFDEVASSICMEGYEVRRLPALVSTFDGWMVSYNNVLLEDRGGQMIVYMPIYQIPTLDAVAAAIYEGLGCEVRTVDVSRIYPLGGALRCAVNVIRRRPSTSVPDLQLDRPYRGVRLMNLSGNAPTVCKTSPRPSHRPVRQ